MSLVCLELLVIRKLDVHGSSSQLCHATGEVGYHSRGSHFVRHLQECLEQPTQQMFTILSYLTIISNSVYSLIFQYWPVLNECAADFGLVLQQIIIIIIIRESWGCKRATAKLDLYIDYNHHTNQVSNNI